MHAVLGPRQPKPKEQEEDGNCDRIWGPHCSLAARAERSLGGASTIAAAAGILAQKRLPIDVSKPTVIKNPQLAPLEWR
jgi:hypothetical protein